MLKFVLIMVGGGLGSLLRYATSGAVYRFVSGVFPWGTLVVNLSGSFAIGFLWGLAERFPFSVNTKAFIFVGILGGFTTFSTFSLENLNLLRDGETKLALINILCSNVLGIGLAFLGFGLARYLCDVAK